MDPLTIISAIGSVGSLIDLLGKTIALADRWYNSYNDAPSEVEQLRRELQLVQCTTSMINSILLLSRNSQDPNPALPELQAPEFSRSLLGAQMTLQRVYSECSAIEARFKPIGSRKLVWALADRRRVDRLRESLERIQSGLSSFLNIHALAVQLVVHENSRREVRQSREDMKQLLAAVQGGVAHPSPQEQTIQKSPATNLNLIQNIRRKHKPRLLRKILAASVQWQQNCGCSFRLSGTTSADELVSTYTFFWQLTFPTGLFGDKTLNVTLSLGVGTPWYERVDILGGGIRTHNTVPYTSEVVSAAHRGNVDVLQMLFTHGHASIKDITPDMRPLLWHAIDGDSIEAVEYLLNSKADATALAGPYQTELLSRAFYRRNIAISRLLIKHGVDLDHINGSGTTPAHHLFNPRSRPTSNSQFLDMLATEGFTNLNVQDEFGETALHRAASHGIALDVEHLLRLGADYTLRTTPPRSWTPLFSAAFNNNPVTLRQLAVMIQERENISFEKVLGEIDARGWTPLHVAVEGGCFAAVRELLSMGADPFSLTIPSLDGRFCDVVKGRAVSPVDLARHKGRGMLERFELLMRESGKHETYLDEEGDVFWPAGTMEGQDRGCQTGCCKTGDCIR